MYLNCGYIFADTKRGSAPGLRRFAKQKSHKMERRMSRVEVECMLQEWKHETQEDTSFLDSFMAGDEDMDNEWSQWMRSREEERMARECESDEFWDEDYFAFGGDYSPHYEPKPFEKPDDSSWGV